MATSSVGSTIGAYGPERAMTPHQLSKAFLATRGLAQEGMAARMIASKFTNRWRYGAPRRPRALRDDDGDGEDDGHDADASARVCGWQRAPS